MIKEAIERILELAPPTITKHEGLEYSNQDLIPILPPQPSVVHVSTLQGLAGLYHGNLDRIIETQVLVHVTSPTTVELSARDSDVYSRRRVWAVAEYPNACKLFPFGAFLDPEQFIIWAQVCFQRVKIERDNGEMAKDLDYVLKTASKISAGKERINEDDGISQTVQVKAGVTLRTEETLKPIVNLAPYRTFAEIDQVVSKFIFRAQGNENGAKLALIEADGGRWRLDATAAIVKWLSSELPDLDIIS